MKHTLFVLMMIWGTVSAQSSVGINLGVLPARNLMVTYEYAGTHGGVRPFFIAPIGGKDKLGGGIDLRLYNCPVKPTFRFYLGISIGVWRTDKYETPYVAHGVNMTTVYSGFLCTGVNLNSEKFVFSLGFAGGLSGWKMSGRTFGWFGYRPEFVIAYKLNGSSSA